MKKNNRTFFIILAGIVVVLGVCFTIYLLNGATTNGETAENMGYVEDGKLILISEDPTPQFAPDTEISKEEAEKKALEVAVSAQTYYDEYSEQAELISKNGYFYDFPAGKYIDIQTMITNETMTADSADNKGFTMYLNTAYLNETGGLDLEENPQNPLSIVGVYPLENSFIVKNAQGSGGEVPKDDMENVMAKHDTDHGQVVRYNQDSDTFKEIVKTLSNEFDGKDLDVRYLAGDEKYAFAVVSPVGEPANIRQYVLVNDGNDWVVGLSELQRERQFRVTINQKYPDLNMGMLPSYNLYYQLKYVATDYTDILVAMEQSQLITKDDGEPVFISGNKDFIYITFEKGKKFVGEYEETGWVMHPVSGFEAAEIFLLENSENGQAPLYLVKQEF